MYLGGNIQILASLAKIWFSGGRSVTCPKIETMRKEAIRERLWKETSGHCVYCGHPVSPEEMEIDHIVPRSIGGGGEYLNKVCACHGCNASKGSLLLEEYIERMDGRKRRCYKNRIDSLVVQGRMSDLKAEMLYPLPEEDDFAEAREVAGVFLRLTEWQVRRVLADILIGRGASMKKDYGRKEEKQYGGYD